MIVLDATKLFHLPGNSGAKSRVESDNGCNFRYERGWPICVTLRDGRSRFW
jgi:hypothetical protein